MSMFGAQKRKGFEQALPSEHLVATDGQKEDEQLVVGLGLKVTGDIETKARLRIDGEIHGEISASAVLVSEKARVTGGIIADEIVIEGELMGTARGKRVLLKSTCRVQADIFHESLVIEDDATFEGRMLRSANSGSLRPTEARHRDGADFALSEAVQDGSAGDEGRGDFTSPQV